LVHYIYIYIYIYMLHSIIHQTHLLLVLLGFPRFYRKQEKATVIARHIILVQPGTGRVELFRLALYDEIV